MIQESKHNTKFDFEEIHIVKRDDEKGYYLKGKGVYNGESCSIDIPILKKPCLNINVTQDTEYNYFRPDRINLIHKSVDLSLTAMVDQENGTYCLYTLDPVCFAKKRIKKLEDELEEIKNEAEEKTNEILTRIQELKNTI